MSITVSGDRATIDELHNILDEKKDFQSQTHCRGGLPLSPYDLYKTERETKTLS